MNYLKIAGAAALLMAFSAPAWSAPLTPGEALNAALASGARRMAPAAGLADASAYTLKWTGPRAGVYVFERKNGGFIMAAGDDSNPAPLLGYSPDGTFDPDNIPPALQGVIESFARGNMRMTKTRTAREKIEPMLTTQWNQDVPYNLDCPKVGASRTYTGCGATAIAQIMKKWEYPEAGMGVGSGYTNTQTYNFNFVDHPFDWENMLDRYRGVKVNEVQSAAVSNLMYAAGMAVNMHYGTEASGCYISDVVSGLVEHLTYDRGLQLRYRDAYEIDDWNAMVYEELKAGRPLYYTGVGNGMGHAFVCDGYDGTDGDYFHFNWGWGGVADGYFLVNNMTPGQTGIGAGYGTYNDGQFVIFNLKPAEKGSTFYPSFLTVGMMRTSRQRYSRSSSLMVDITFDQPTAHQEHSDFHAGALYSLSAANLTVNFGVLLTDVQTGEQTYLFDPQGASTHILSGFYGFSVPTDRIPEEGTFTVNPIVLSNGVAYDIPEEVYNKKQLMLRASADELEFYNDDSIISGVGTIDAVEPEGEPTIYDMSGVKVKETVPGTIYIAVDKNGHARRFLAK